MKRCTENEPHQHIKAVAYYDLVYIARHEEQYDLEFSNANVLSLTLY